MEPRTKIIPVQLEDGTSIKIDAIVMGGEQDVLALDKVLPFKKVIEGVERVAGEILATLQKVRPDKASVEFGVEFALESGAMTALIAKGSGSSNLKITLEWTKETMKP